jgi:hypothetical protein
LRKKLLGENFIEDIGFFIAACGSRKSIRRGSSRVLVVILW